MTNSGLSARPTFPLTFCAAGQCQDILGRQRVKGKRVNGEGPFKFCLLPKGRQKGAEMTEEGYMLDEGK